MYKVTRLVTLKDGASPEARQTVALALEKLAAETGGLIGQFIRPTLLGVFNGGDLVWHMHCESDTAPAAKLDVSGVPGVQSVEVSGYEGGESGRQGAPLAKGVYRVLLLSVLDGTPPVLIGQFEEELVRMPHYIPAIRAWQLSRVKHASGSRPWTHVWEQEFADLGGLQGPYMLHPYHWGYIDRWFDPEHQDRIVDSYLCHTFCDFSGTVITK